MALPYRIPTIFYATKYFNIQLLLQPNMMAISKVHKGFFLILPIVASLFIVSCQKEIDGPLFVFGCKVNQWSDLDSAGNITGTFTYTYDSTNGKPTSMRYESANGANATVIPVQKKDTIYYNVGSYAVVDNSSRVLRLEEQNSITGQNGTYSYTYDASGHLATRVYDDGVTPQTTKYTYSGDDLATVDEPLLGVANALVTTYTYGTNTVKDYNNFILAEILPELRLYLTTLNFGKFTNKAIASTKTKVNIPFVPITEINTTYTNYVFDTKNNVTKVQIDGNFGTGTFRSYYGANYLCK
jgi:hypothetical protein